MLARMSVSIARQSAELRMAVFRLARRLRLEKTDDDLSDSQFGVLAVLNRFGPHTLSMLAERERVSPPSMNRTVNFLEARGYLRRDADAGGQPRVPLGDGLPDDRCSVRGDQDVRPPAVRRIGIPPHVAASLEEVHGAVHRRWRHPLTLGEHRERVRSEPVEHRQHAELPVAEVVVGLLDP